MKNKNWVFTDTDAAIAGRIESFLPRAVFDFHAHIYRTQDLGFPLQGLVAQGPETVGVDVWRELLGHLLGPSRLAGGLLFPYPTKTVEAAAANKFLLSELADEEMSRGLILVKPESLQEEVEALLENDSIVGFKPYHVFAHVESTFDSALEEYAPEWLWQVADERGLIIMVHLVRSGALSDPVNQESILRLCSHYPDVRLVLAHAGRGFHALTTLNALPALGHLKNIWFETSAICEPDALMAILRVFGPRRMLWGSDFPVSHQRGKCVTVGDAFSWICPERIDDDPTAPPCHPTLVGLESLRALALATILLDISQRDIENIFLHNALRLLDQ